MQSWSKPHSNSHLQKRCHNSQAAINLKYNLITCHLLKNAKYKKKWKMNKSQPKDVLTMLNK